LLRAYVRALISLVRLSLWFAYLFGSTISLFLLLSLWFDYLFGLALVVLPVVVRFDVARGTRGIVVRVNVARVLSVLSLISSRLLVVA
jgi:hypothetical protein